ncbi:MAG: hypothetical protein MUO31_07110 [Thermodesulfovibrionales bacterium]|nr:hypothetical protein [Thermodesulfovibrionales bacterium]
MEVYTTDNRKLAISARVLGNIADPNGDTSRYDPANGGAQLVLYCEDELSGENIAAVESRIKSENVEFFTTTTHLFEITCDGFLNPMTLDDVWNLGIWNFTLWAPESAIAGDFEFKNSAFVEGSDEYTSRRITKTNVSSVLVDPNIDKTHICELASRNYPPTHSVIAGNGFKITHRNIAYLDDSNQRVWIMNMQEKGLYFTPLSQTLGFYDCGYGLYVWVSSPDVMLPYLGYSDGSNNSGDGAYTELKMTSLCSEIIDRFTDISVTTLRFSHVQFDSKSIYSCDYLSNILIFAGALPRNVPTFHRDNLIRHTQAQLR